MLLVPRPYPSQRSPMAIALFMLPHLSNSILIGVLWRLVLGNVFAVTLRTATNTDQAFVCVWSITSTQSLLRAGFMTFMVSMIPRLLTGESS